MISVIITTFDEGDKLRATVESVRKNTSDVDIVVVDDGSTDGSTDDLGDVVLVRHDDRIGIAQSRLDGVAAAKGNAYAFLDAHQAVEEGALNKLAEVAIEHQAITYACQRGPVDRMTKRGIWTGHGCTMAQQTNGLFVGRWKNYPPKDRLSRCSMMIVPGYVIPADVYHKVRWNDGMKQWGGSEPNVCVKAFFADVDIIHVCGPIVRHEYRAKDKDKRGNTIRIHRPFRCPFSITWRNHALTARICFDDRSWEQYWIPSVFGKWCQDFGEFYTDEVLQQHQEFAKYKVRGDNEFWRGLIQLEPYDYRMEVA